MCRHTFFVATNFTKFYFLMLKKKIWSNLKKIIELFTQKIVNKLSKNGFGIRDPEKPIPDPGSRIQGSKGHRIPIRIRNTYIDSICMFFFTRKFSSHFG